MVLDTLTGDYDLQEARLRHQNNNEEKSTIRSWMIMTSKIKETFAQILMYPASFLNDA